MELEGLRPSVGTIGDAYDNAQAESVMGLFKNEAVRKDSPFRVGPLKTVADVEDLTLEWATWYNQDRLTSDAASAPVRS
ncbi:transposase [Actinomycetaceae bacterium WB03_NA08]|uniref:Transposase n=1 Tax=Scrofimicrobium canadense TaxID=2652290 RepID=A0A6N7WAF8_9ACTO|nr:transposase [Scrofimicrobium canadense]